MLLFLGGVGYTDASFCEIKEGASSQRLSRRRLFVKHHQLYSDLGADIVMESIALIDHGSEAIASDCHDQSNRGRQVCGSHTPCSCCAYAVGSAPQRARL